MKHGVSSVVVADANVLLSAVAGRAVSRILYSELEIHTTFHTWAEVIEYIPVFQARFKLTIEDLDMSLGTAPIWTNDRDFEDFPMGRYTTAQLLEILES